MLLINPDSEVEAYSMKERRRRDAAKPRVKETAIAGSGTLAWVWKAFQTSPVGATQAFCAALTGLLLLRMRPTGLRPLRGLRPGLCCVALSALQSTWRAEGTAQNATSAMFHFHRVFH